MATSAAPPPTSFYTGVADGEAMQLMSQAVINAAAHPSLAPLNSHSMSAASTAAAATANAAAAAAAATATDGKKAAKAGKGACVWTVSASLRTVVSKAWGRSQRSSTALLSAQQCW